ncbi:hypothetical protein IQE94_05450 [Synechocystis sp. PCC 7339]|uniref:hypothetical protein n=1 Tax=Synechocystis sp. PCC 7339 TaxID=2782213 RepID=UPI001CC10BA3|nr:hypothetical protein [Synechocystis sp. PCC 7339]UAJ73727.1 hypothetical protein IQE94_05450 [Synechocystis sp. PCC 7339]
MNWLTITPTQIELELEGTTPLALLESLLDKVSTAGLGSVAGGFAESGLIYRFDGQLYDYADYKLQIITEAPEINLNIEDIN